jgi:DNA-binding PadR family transcriptional regulator
LQALTVPGYGRELIERVHRATAGQVRLRFGSVYPALSRLAREGLVRAEVARVPGAAGRPRKYYELTVRGVAKARAEREALGRLLCASEGLPAPEPAQRLLARLVRAAAVSASALDLRRRMRMRD